MAVRTTQANVDTIIEVDASITDYTPFIAVANTLVTEKCTGGDLTATELEMIERWLAAHFITVRDKQVISAGISGGPNVKYESKVDLGLDSSRYGQTAMLLDTTGGLAAYNQQIVKGKGSSITLTWLGTSSDD